MGFLEDRLGVRNALQHNRRQPHPPQGIGFLRTLGFAALTVLMLQVLSGIALALHYVPTTGLAYDSIRAFEADIVYGSLVRGLHHIGASALIVAMVVQLLRVYFTGAYKRPRELTWITGVVLLVMVVGLDFTGALLPWDQNAFFGTKVRTDMVASTPLIGGQISEILRGGSDLGQPSLTRFYVLHIGVLPLALFGMLGLHLHLVQRFGLTPPGCEVGEDGAVGPDYHPNHTWRAALVGATIACGLFFASHHFHAPPLEALADPADANYEPRSEWYFRGLSYLLAILTTPKEVGTFWIPAGCLTLLILLPLLDRGRHRRWSRRWFMTPLGVLVVLTIGTLTTLGLVAMPGHDQPVAEDDDPGPTLPFPLGLTDLERQGYLLVRQQKCLECHQHSVDGQTYGKTQHEAPDFAEMETESIEDVAGVIEEGSEDMPADTNLTQQERLAAGAFVMFLIEQANRDK